MKISQKYKIHLYKKYMKKTKYVKQLLWITLYSQWRRSVCMQAEQRFRNTGKLCQRGGHIHACMCSCIRQHICGPQWCKGAQLELVRHALIAHQQHIPMTESQSIQLGTLLQLAHTTRTGEVNERPGFAQEQSAGRTAWIHCAHVRDLLRMIST